MCRKAPIDPRFSDFATALARRLGGLCIAIVSSTYLAGCDGGGVVAPSGSEWQWRALATDLEVRCLDVSGDGIVFAGATDGIHRSRDHGRTWEWLSSSWPSGVTRVVLDLDFGPGNLVACATTAGVYVSKDAGDTWTLSQITNMAGESVSPKAVAVGSGGVLLAAATGRYNGIFRSEDTGASWEQPVLLLEDWLHSVQYLMATPSGVVFLGIGFGADMRSTDNGLRWQPFSVDGSSPYNLPYPTDVAADSLGAFLLCNHDEIWKSVDDGATWSRVFRTGAFTTLASGAPGEVFAGTYDGFVHWTTTSGAEWMIVGSFGRVVLALAAGTQGELYVATARPDRSEYRMFTGVNPLPRGSTGACGLQSSFREVPLVAGYTPHNWLVQLRRLTWE